MQGRRGCRVAYDSMTQDITGCHTEVDRFLSEYAVVPSFKDASRFLTIQIISVLQPSIYRETARANAGVSS